MTRRGGASDVAAALARGFGGSILFALPLLMTMEMWWLGFYLSPTRILLLMAVFFPILIGVSHYIGFDDTGGLGHAALHAITAYGRLQYADEAQHDAARDEGAAIGHKTGAQVLVEGELKSGDAPAETSSVTFDYLPGGSIRYGGLLFRRDPRIAQLTLRPLGYRDP